MRMNTSFMTPDAPYKVDVVREKKREEFFIGVQYILFY